MEDYLSIFLDIASGKLGHASVATYPDRPFLNWEVEFEKPRPSNGVVSNRDNPATYLEGCRNIYNYFRSFVKNRYTDSDDRSFEDIRNKVDEILRFEGKKEDRIGQWLSAIRNNSIYTAAHGELGSVSYDPQDWEDQKKSFHNLYSSEKGLELDVYRFHQAATIHRYYVLKELLPAYNIAVY